MNGYDVAVIGGGPAGMAAALSASAEGARVVVLERNVFLGGILMQCIHNGFGLHYFKEELTGPEYAERFVKKVLADKNIDVMTDTMVLSVSEDKTIVAINPEKGCFSLKPASIVLAMGCRERPGGAIQLCGGRPCGVYTAGAAQRIVNIEGYKIGKRAVILGSGDIGLIMTRRMIFEGAQVECVCEIMPYSSGLKRNIVQCLNDFNVPLYFSTTVTRIVGKDKLEGVYIASVDERMRPIKETERFVECDTLLLSVGLIPENDLIATLNIDMDGVTSGAVVNERRETSMPGIFSAGNVLHVHDLVDNVSVEAETAGKYAALHAKGGYEKSSGTIKISASSGVRYALPQAVSDSAKNVEIFFRVGNVYKNTVLKVTSGGKLLKKKRCRILLPGEMEKITVDLTDLPEKSIELSLEI